MADYEHTGLWWLPSEPTTRLGGTLEGSSEEKFYLELIGTFEGSEQPWGEKVDKYPIILGESKQGKRLTLCDCLSLGTSRGYPGIASQRVFVPTGYVGAHFEDERQMKFYKAYIQYSHLGDWIAVRGLQNELIVGEGGIERVVFVYEHPEDELEELKANLDGNEVSINVGFGSSRSGLRGISLSETVSIKVELSEEMGYEDIHSKYIYPLKNLITMGTGRANYPTEVVVFSRYWNEVASHRPGGELPIEVMYTVRVGREARSNFTLIESDMLFTLRDVENRFDELIRSWFEVADGLDSVCNLLFGVKNNPEMYLDQKFINVVHAAESYHSRRVSNRELPKDEHKKRVKAILANVPEEYREWLERKLDFSNRPSLRNRLEDLIEGAREIFDPLVNDRDVFIGSVVGTRNYYIHHIRRGKKKRARGLELLVMMRILYYVMEFYLLTLVSGK